MGIKSENNKALTPLFLIFRFHGYQQQIEHFGTSLHEKSLQQIVPSKGAFPFAFAKPLIMRA